MSNKSVNTTYALSGVLTSVAGEALVLASHSGGVGTIVALAAGAAVYSILKDTKTEAGKDFPLPAIPMPTRKPRTPGELSLAYRLVHGKSTRGGEVTPDEAPEPSPKAQDGIWIPPQFTLESVLDVVRAFNAQGYIYFGESVNGAVAIPLDDMYHVIDVSSSGKGKSNRFRLAMMQMVESCETYYINPFAASVKAVKDDRKIEVGKPIYDRLANKQPVKEGPDILQVMTFLVEEITRRNGQEENGDFSWQDRPIFVFIDELPEVFARCPAAVKLLDKIGRAGRQFDVFAWIASQTALTSEIGQSTAAQANYKTRIYGGGDKTSCDRLMKGSIPSDTERTLQSNKAGLSLMLAEGMESLSFVRAPLVTNEGLFDFYELPPFSLSDWVGKSAPTSALRLVNSSEEDLLPFPFSPENQSNQPFTPSNSLEDERKRGKGKRVKGPNEEIILEAIEALEGENRALTMNAIAKTAQLTRHQYEEIEDVVVFYGYELEQGKGRPPSDQTYRK